ncbi:unnamed protein product [Lampetra fluviatilis]
MRLCIPTVLMFAQRTSPAPPVSTRRAFTTGRRLDSPPRAAFGTEVKFPSLSIGGGGDDDDDGRAPPIRHALGPNGRERRGQTEARAESSDLWDLTPAVQRVPQAAIAPRPRARREFRMSSIATRAVAREPNARDTGTVHGLVARGSSIPHGKERDARVAQRSRREEIGGRPRGVLAHSRVPYPALRLHALHSAQGAECWMSGGAAVSALRFKTDDPSSTANI